MASIRRLPSGNHQAMVRRVGHPPLTKSLSTRKQAEARRIESDIDASKHFGLASVRTLADLVKRVLQQPIKIKSVKDRDRGDRRHGEILSGRRDSLRKREQRLVVRVRALTGGWLSGRLDRLIGILLGATLLAGCAVLPAGPTVSVLPGSSVPFTVFQADDSACRSFAFSAVDPNAPAIAGAESAVGSALLGAAIGALFGAATGDAGAGAAIGGGTGLLFGSAVGADRANATAYYGQQRYNYAYVQCMYARGHRVPVSMAPVPAPAVWSPPVSTYPPRGYPPSTYPR